MKAWWIGVLLALLAVAGDADAGGGGHAANVTSTPSQSHRVTAVRRYTLRPWHGNDEVEASGLPSCGARSARCSAPRSHRPARSEMLWSAENADFWPLVYLAAQFPETLERAAATLEPAVVAKYAFQLAQLSNEFYHQHPVRDEPDETRRALLVEVIGSVRQTLVAALAALGIDAPRRM